MVTDPARLRYSNVVHVRISSPTSKQKVEVRCGFKASPQINAVANLPATAL